MATTHRRTFLKAVGGAAVAGGLAVAKPEKPRIKIGQIGVGHAHATKLAVYRRSPDYEVIGIVEPDAALRTKAERQVAFQGLPWMSREQLLNTPGLQAVLVETRVRDLLTIAGVCIAAGKHIHLDKPAGESLPRFRRILDSARRQSLLVQMGYMFRYNPGFVLLREFLARGWLGEPFDVHAVMSKVLDVDSRNEAAPYSGGIMFELGCHLVDQVVGLFDRPKTIASYKQHVAKVDDKLLDNMLAVFTYPKMLASVKSSAVEVEGMGRRHFVVCGSEGTFHIQPLDDPSARIALSGPRDKYRKGIQEVAFPKYERYVADAADMARIIRGEKASDFSYEHDLAVQETLLAACGLADSK
jgi:predicted dehydrogenase